MMSLDKMVSVKLISCLLLLTVFVGKSSEDEFLPNGQVEFGLSRQDDEPDLYHKEPEKRGIKGVIFAVSIAATLSNVGLDIYLGNKGCCKLQKGKYKDACEKIADIKRMVVKLNELGQKLNKVNLQAQMDSTYLTHINTRIDKINAQIERLRSLEQSVVDVMSPRVVNQFKEKAAKIKELLDKAKGNITRAKPYDATELYKPLYKTWKGRAELFQGAGIHILSELGEAAFDRVLIRKLKKSIETDLRMRITLNQRKANQALKARALLGATDSIEDLVKSMAKVQLRVKKSTSKMGRAFSSFNNGLLIASIGSEIFDFISKLQQCAKNTERMHQAQIKLRKAVAESENVLKQMESGHTEIKDQYNLFRKALTNVSVTDVITGFAHVISAAAPAARRRMHSAEVSIGVYLKYQVEANPSLMSSLQGFLEAGLKTMTIRYDCLLKRTQALAGTIADCVRGDDTLSNIYKRHSEAKLLHKCVTQEGEPFVTLHQVKKVITSDIAQQKDKYRLNCLLNKESRIKVFCKEKCVDGYTYQHVLAKYPSISVSELRSICEPDGKCKTVPLTPTQKSSICLFKGNNPVTMFYNAYKNASRAEIKKVYDSCPTGAPQRDNQH